MDKISLGIDIATSISVIGAAISFMISQQKTRKQSQAQYAVSNLKVFLMYIHESGQKYDAIGNELRLNPTQENLDKNILQTIFFLEDMERELTSLIEIYLPIFSTQSEIPDTLKRMDTELNGLIEVARSGRENFAILSQNIEPFLHSLELSVALELKNIMQQK